MTANRAAGTALPSFLFDKDGAAPFSPVRASALAVAILLHVLLALLIMQYQVRPGTLSGRFPGFSVLLSIERPAPPAVVPPPRPAASHIPLPLPAPVTTLHPREEVARPLTSHIDRPRRLSPRANEHRSPTAPSPAPRAAVPQVPVVRPVLPPPPAQAASAPDAGHTLVGRIRDNWLEPAGASESFHCRIRIRVAPSGQVLAVQLLQSCGSGILDDSISRAIWKTVVEPGEVRNSSAGSLEIEFSP